MSKIKQRLHMIQKFYKLYFEKPWDRAKPVQYAPFALTIWFYYFIPKFPILYIVPASNQETGSEFIEWLKGAGHTRVSLIFTIYIFVCVFMF